MIACIKPREKTKKELLLIGLLKLYLIMVKSKSKLLHSSKLASPKAEVYRHCFGIDIGKKEFYVCYRYRLSDGRSPLRASKKFVNTAKGIASFYQWSIKHLKGSDKPCSFLMEATGVYYEDLAYYLYDQSLKVQVVLPNQSKAYGRSLNQKTKTDKVDAQTLSLMGLERPNIRVWQPGSSLMRHLKKMTRLRSRLVEEKTRNQNQLLAEKDSYDPDPKVITMLDDAIKTKKKMIKDLENSLQQTVEQKDEILREKIQKICQLKGLGFITVLTIIAETNGFELFKSIKQLISYSGYDIVQNQSGQKEGKTRISKKEINTLEVRSICLPYL